MPRFLRTALTATGCWGFSYFGAIGIKQNFKDSFNAVGTGIWSYSKDSRVLYAPRASPDGYGVN